MRSSLHLISETGYFAYDVEADITDFPAGPGHGAFTTLKIQVFQTIVPDDVDDVGHRVFLDEITVFDPDKLFHALDAAREAYAHRHETFDNGGPAPEQEG